MQIGIRGRGAPTIFLFQRYLQSNNSSAAVGNVVVSVLSIVLHINLLIANPILTLTQRLTVISGKRALCFVVSETEQNWTVVYIFLRLPRIRYWSECILWLRES